MCRYCNYDVSLHYLINDAPRLNESSVVKVNSSETIAPQVCNDTELGIYAGAPEFNEESWNFTDQAEKQLYGQIGIVDRPFDLAFAENIFKDDDRGDALTYSATLADDSSLPDWLNIDSSTGKFTGIPRAQGNFEIKLIATDIRMEKLPPLILLWKY